MSIISNKVGGMQGFQNSPHLSLALKVSAVNVEITQRRVGDDPKAIQKNLSSFNLTIFDI
jgi:hypothetical protein